VYTPEDDGPPNRPGRPLRLSTRRRVYFVLMGTCLVLIVLSWMVVWRFSLLAAIIMSAVALFVPPVAVIIANSGPANRR
jgi:Protein of unknown function (DUF3099)